MKLICYYLSMDYIKNMGLWDFIASERDIKNNICLYAYTTKKKIAKEFEKYRDMNKFIKRVHDVTKEEFDDFESSNIYHKIDIYELLTRSDNEDELVCPIRLPVVEIENSYCEDTYEFIDDSFVDCYTVIKSMNTILKSIKSKKVKKRIGKNIYDTMMDISIKISNDVSMAIDEDMEVDTLALFLQDFHNLLDIKE